MGASTGSGVGGKCNYSIGCNHAYTIIDLKEVKVDDGRTFRLFKFRNPWRADAGFNGSFADESPMWNLTLKGVTLAKTLNRTIANDGIYWLQDIEVLDGLHGL